MRLLLISLALLAATPACAEPQPAPAVQASGDLRTASSPEPFIRALYASYSDADDANPWAGDAVWSRRMAALVRRDQELAGEELPYLDADPICSCQDWGRVSVQSVVLRVATMQGAIDATVRFVNLGVTETTILRMVREESGWRVDDIVNADGYPGLADQLAQSNARIEAGGKALGRD